MQLIVHAKQEFKVWKFETPVLHIKLGACTLIAFLN